MLASEVSYFADRAGGIITRGVLVSVRRVALRAGVYFRAIGRLERALFECAIRVVRVVWSDVLAKVLMRIIVRLLQAARSIPLALAEYIGARMASRAARIAQGWGYEEARDWKNDLGFIRWQALNYLLIRSYLDPSTFREWLNGL